MQDRISKYPGRVKLVPVDGQENTYDLIRADEPQQDGDPINKATLLKDATAALYGLDSSALPDDVFKRLSKCVVFGSYVGTDSKTFSLTFPFKPTICCIYNSQFLANGYYFTYTSGGSTLAWNNTNGDESTTVLVSLPYYSTYASSFKLTFSGTTINFSAQDNGSPAFNTTNYTYYYYAIKALDEVDE